MGQRHRLVGLAWVLALAVFASSFLAPAAGFAQTAAERRIALVIGNSNYEALTPLKNPLNDAADVARLLKQFGFETSLLLDARLDQIRSALADLSRRGSGATATVVYFAGHGLQVNQANYLVPVEAELTSEQDVYERTLKFSEVLDALDPIPGIRMIFLDACQNDPLPETARQRVDGLARVGSSANTMVTFATQPGMVAFDGINRNSPFTEALLAHLPRQGLEVLPMLTAVNTDVNTATGGLQTPFVQFSVKPEFYFVPGEREVETPDVQLWRLAANARDPNLLQIYLARFPEGPHTGDARALLSTLQEGASTPPATAAASNLDAEEALWRLGRNGRIHALVDLYLTRYPDGRFAAEARDLLASLTPIDDPSTPPGARCAALATHPRDATANVAGVSLDKLSTQADAAIEACRAALAAHPELPHYLTLLGRAEAARGDKAASLSLFQEAADRGDARALVTMGLITEAGDGVPRDLAKAADFYRRAAETGSIDGMINYGVVLIEGTGVAQDKVAGVDWMRKAAATGAAIALHNLGALAESGVTGNPGEALSLFQKAAEQGYAPANRAAAVLLDEGRTTGRDPKTAAEFLLRGIATDSGELLGEITAKPRDWAPETIAAMQGRLLAAGYYEGEIDGRAGPKFAAALRQWRLLGPPV